MGGGGGGGGALLIDKRVIVHNNTGRLYITNQEIDFSFFLWCVWGGGGGGGGGYLQQTASQPFVELCFEAGK